MKSSILLATAFSAMAGLANADCNTAQGFNSTVMTDVFTQDASAKLPIAMLVYFELDSDIYERLIQTPENEIGQVLNTYYDPQKFVFSEEVYLNENFAFVHGMGLFVCFEDDIPYFDASEIINNLDGVSLASPDVALERIHNFVEPRSEPSP